MRIVLKIGGNEIDDSTFLAKVTSLVSGLQKENHRLILVHGGGKEITGLLDKLGVETKFVNGMRYTDERSLAATEMVLSGGINKRLVRTFERAGVNAIGASGVDASILVAERITRSGEDLGLVGEVSAVNVKVIESLMRDFVLVLSPVSLEKGTGNPLNVNADYAAAAIARFIRAELVIFLSNVPGVISSGEVLPKVEEKEFERLKQEGVITGGMIPKIESGLRAVKGGAKIAFITNADGAAAIVSGKNAGTQVTV